MRFWWMGSLLLWVCGVAIAQNQDEVQVVVERARGIDQRVNYEDLTRFGPWDDRNYLLTAEDLALLPPGEEKIQEPLPAFFRVFLRRSNPNLPREGEAQYPLSAVNTFNQLYGGYEVDGKRYQGIRRSDDGQYFYRSEEKEESLGWPKFLNGEVKVSTPNGAAESAIAINPIDRNKVVAGTNGPGSGQRMWRSSDGGATWVESQPLTNGGTCCDPTVSWSTDGTKAYGSALVNCGGAGCGIRVYRSDDFGNIWGDNDAGTPVPAPVTVIASGADKQFLHVDTSNSSPRKDRLYMCWHEGNVQKFSHSTDLAVSFQPSVTVDGLGRGVGCDVTSDAVGNVYYFYPSLDSGDAATRRQIRVAKSTDGGVSFQPAVTVANNQDAFNYPLPSMETRRVAKIVQADADISGGPFNNSIYVIWPDLTAPESATPANNHSIVRVGYSRDGGATWTVTSPHSLADVNTVDRYQPSIKVDMIGRVHVIYYDTIRSADRTRVDVFYNISYDGAQTWGTPVRITAQQSPNVNDNFEFGDYSHMDGVLEDMIAIYTDNRDESGGSAQSKDVYAAAGFQEPFTAGFLPSLSATSQDICAGGSAQPVNVTVRGVLNYTGNVTLSTPGLPAAVTSPQFSVNPVAATAAGATSQFSFGIANGTPSGPVDITIQGSGAGANPGTRSTSLRANVFAPLAGAPALNTPANGAASVSTAAQLTWTALPGASSYRVQVASDAAFTNIVAQQSGITGTSYTLNGVQPQTEYFWRVRAENICGPGADSVARNFTTAAEFCRAPNLAIPDNNVVGVTDSITIPGTVLGNVTDMNVYVKVTHTYIGDLRISVRTASGTPNVPLINNPANCSGDNMDLSFDDESANAFACNNAAVPAVGPGNARPVALLSGLDGQAHAQTWTLFVADSAGQDVGTVDLWCLIPTLPIAPGPNIFENGFE